MRSYTFLVNPRSGGGAAPEAVVPASRLLRDAGAEVEVTYSPGPKATVALVAAAVDRGDVVVSVGGDGMLSSLAGEVSARGGVLGLLPAGRGNDFARMVGISRDDTEGAVRVLLEAEPRKVDLLRYTGPGGTSRVVAGSVYGGVDAVAAEIVDRSRFVPKSLQYPLAAVRALAAYRPAEVEVVVDGAAQTFRAATVVAANSAYYGKGMKIAPGAVLDDGLIDVVVIEAASKLGLIRSMPKVYDGEHVALPEVTVLRGREVTLRGATARGPIPVGGDGEPLGVLPRRGDDPATVTLLPGALNLLG
ncbi:diacylglycerol/lipid kinase family protein [Nocardioides speluncae]|uniref:diacylglycerol/lipid kinase family protein n=1 Tax=Nocardioides speluncae TaxID=2670337 RepID=UPI000D6908D2|nr:diacylglycerol kinase family protein [Nocardioides speluncae]